MTEPGAPAPGPAELPQALVLDEQEIRSLLTPELALEAVRQAFVTYARGDALDYRVIEQSEDAFEIDVRGCRYAEFYKELGEPELGFLLVCSADFDTADGFSPDIHLTRTQTIMQGASHCDFRYKRSTATD